MSSVETARRLVIFDVETTGTDKRRDQVIELCVQFGVEADAEHVTWRIRPDVEIHPGAQAVHGISMADLEGCPRFPEVAQAIRAVFTDAEVLVGYNLAFDIDMLQAEFERAGLPGLELKEKQIVDPFRLWQQCEPRSLQDAHRRFVGAEFAAAHSATADVAATGRVLRGMIASFGLVEDWSHIAQVCEPERPSWIGPSRHIRWGEDGQPVLAFGKYAGTPLHRLAHGPDANYLQWVMDKDFPPHVREVCRRSLELDADGLRAWLVEVFGEPRPRIRPEPVPAAEPSVAAVAVFESSEAIVEVEPARARRRRPGREPSPFQIDLFSWLAG